jgi:alpha-glucosidase
MKTLKNWTLAKQSANHLELLVDSQHHLSLYVLEENLFRVLIKRKGELALE